MTDRPPEKRQRTMTTIPRTGPSCGVRRHGGRRTRRAKPAPKPKTESDAEYIEVPCTRHGTAPEEPGLQGLSLSEKTVCAMPVAVSEYERVLGQRGYRLFERYAVDARMAGDLCCLGFRTPLAVFTDAAADSDGEWFLLFLTGGGEVVEYAGASGRCQNLGRDFSMGWYVGTVGMCRDFLPLPRL